MQQEYWKPVIGYEGFYEVSSLGRVRNRKGKVLKSDLRLKTGYRYVVLCVDKKKFHANIHRLVAKAFIPNPDGLPIINHINEDRADNRVENLEWCDRSYNATVSTKFKNLYKKVVQKTLDGLFVAVYANIHDAAKAIGNIKLATHICKCIRTRAELRKGNPVYSVKGYLWDYYEE